MARPSSDLNLRSLHAGAGPKRSRKDRKKPDPPRINKEAEPETLAFVESLPIAPGLITEERNGQWQVQAPHNDENLWQLQLAQAFGTRSNSLMRVFVDQLSKLCPQVWDADRQDWKESETTWNALIALVADWKPENSAQAALAAQMAATHLMMMKVSSQALNRGHTVLSHDAALSAKLALSYAAQCTAMQALKGQTRTARQSIHVTKETHQHVHYHDERGGAKNENQSHERNVRDATAAGTDDACEALRCKKPGGQSLPCASGKGQRALPLSRGKSGRAEG